MERTVTMIRLYTDKTIRMLFVVFLLLLGCNCVAQATTQEKRFYFEQQDNQLNLYLQTMGSDKIMYRFSYIPSFEKRITPLGNGNIIGFLPTYDASLRIRAWNDLKHDFALFFADLNQERVTVLRTGTGWGFHINDTNQTNIKMVSITAIGESEILFMNEDGDVKHRFTFESTFNPDFIVISKINEFGADIDFEILGQKASYHLNFIDDTAVLYEQSKTANGK